MSFWIYCHVIQHWYVLKDRSKTIHVHRTCSYLYIVLEKEEHVSSSKREDNVSIWKREVHVNIWKREEIVQTKCKQSQSTVPNLLSSHHWQKANNQIHCTRSAHITSLTKTTNQNYCTISLLHHITDKKQTKNNNTQFFLAPKLQLLLVCVLTALAWCHMRLLPCFAMFCVHHTTMRCVTSCKGTYIRCMHV